jgi:hypothetical protein
MKTMTLLILSALLAHSVIASDSWRIKGKVLSVTEEGIIVLCIDDGTFGQSKPKDLEVVFIRGSFDVVDDDKVNLSAFPDGTYQYTNVSGAARTVRAFSL